jgi:hypothetical protein
MPVAVAFALLPLTAACDSALSLFLNSQATTVRLVNDGDFPVQVRIALSDEDDIPEDVLEEFEDELEFTLSAGGRTTLRRDCDDLRAIMVTHAELRIVGDVGPTADSRVLRDGDDFSCGDVITFTFTHSDLLVDFDVSTSVE